jgi:hypothetical protein
MRIGTASFTFRLSEIHRWRPSRETPSAHASVKPLRATQSALKSSLAAPKTIPVNNAGLPKDGPRRRLTNAVATAVFVSPLPYLQFGLCAKQHERRRRFAAMYRFKITSNQ